MKKFRKLGSDTGFVIRCLTLTKLWKMARLTVLLVFLGMGQAFALGSYAQSTTLNLNYKNAALEDVLAEIEDQSEFFFLYNKDLIDVKQKVDVEVRNKKIKEILDALLEEKGIQYFLFDRQIVLSNQYGETGISGQGVLTVQQQNTVSGTVTDKTGEPLPGVTVLVKGTTHGTVTNADGEYSLANFPKDATLQFSFVGMQTQEVIISNQTTINVTMVVDAIGIEEVVAIGYGTMKKKDVVASVSSVGGDKLVESVASDVTNSLSGRLAGVTVNQSSGEPGNSSSNITIRGRTTLGSSSPLVVIDNVPGRSLSDIDPSDIENVSVLKDASAAIYGASAANGVILVTTKRGTEGELQLDIDSYYGFVTATVVPELTNAREYATMISELQMYEGKERKFTDQDIELYGTGEDPWQHPNTDWYDVLIADWTSSSRHNINIHGASNKIAYFFSLGYKNDEAIYEQEKSASYNQFNVRSKLDFSITNWMKLSYDMAGFQNNRKYPGRSTSWIWSEASRMPPTSPAFWPNGLPGPDIERGDNPAVTSTLATGRELQKNYIIQNTLKLSLIPIKYLNIDLSYSYDVDNQYRSTFITPWILYFADWDTGQDTDGDGFFEDVDLIPIERSQFGSPQLTEEYDRNFTKLSNINVYYDRSFGSHSLNVFAGVEQIINESNDISAFRKDYISSEIATLDAGGEDQKTNSGSAYYYARRSYIGRVNYDFKEKYLATFTFRRDGSLKYPPDGRWGNFPSIMIGWRASEENFWKENISFVNYLKLRASYGKLGMDPGSPFQYLNKYTVGNGLAMGTGRNIESRVYLQSFANKLITWEKEDTYNIGIESQFLNNKFSLEADYFYKKRYDILAQRNASMPDYTGLKLPQENLAEVDNRGVEFVVSYNETFGKDFRLNLSGNLSYNRNKVVYMDEPPVRVPWQQREGQSYGAMLVYDVTGVFSNQAAVDSNPHWPGAKPGDLIFRDVDGDGEITPDDRIILDKVNTPRTFYGISLDLNYKNWNLFMLFQGQGELYQNIVSGKTLIGESGNYYKFMYNDRWTLGEIPGVEENINTNVPRPFEREDQYWALGRAPGSDNNYWWRNTGEYARFKNAVLSYSFPREFGRNIGISSARVFLRGNNLFFIYRSQKVRDPEASNIQAYPLPKTIALGVNATF